MKNLKRTLSLILAFALICSLFAVSAGASFADQKDIENLEAATVLNELGVIEGYSDGTFQGDKTLTRAEAATIICRMLLGADAAKMTVSTAPFDDVAADHWAAGYIAYCVAEGIISGNGDGTFSPDGELTVVQFAKMLLCALGYDATIEGFTGINWESNVNKYANSIGIYDDIDVAAATCTREAAAQMALNTLKATMVYYPSGNVSIDANGTIITVNGSGYTKEAANKYDGNIFIDGGENGKDGYLQFAENYFTSLKYAAANGSYGRPSAYVWTINKDKIFEGVDEDNLIGTYTASVTKGTLYTLVGKTAIDDIDEGEAELKVYLDGETQVATLANYFKKSSGVAATGTGRGVLTEVYMDDDNVTIVEINTYLAIATDDYDDASETLDIQVYGHGTLDSETISNDDFALTGYAEDDYLLITVDDGEIASVAKAETVEGAVSAYSAKASVTVGGSKYSVSKKMDTTTEFDMADIAIDDEIVIVLDAYGNLIGYNTDNVSTSKNYVFLAEVATTGSLSSSGFVGAIYNTDGTYDEVTVKKIDGATTALTSTEPYGWCTYSVDSNGKYTFTTVENVKNSFGKFETVNDSIQFVKDDGNLTVAGYKATSATVFIVVDEDDNVKSYTGYKRVPTINSSNAEDIGVYAVKNTAGYATYVFIDNRAGAASKTASSSGDGAVLVYKTSGTENIDGEGNSYYTYTALVDGVKKSVNVTDKSIMALGCLYTDVTYDENGYVDDATLVNAPVEDEFTYQVVESTDTITYSGNVVTIGTEDYDLADDCGVFIVYANAGKSTADWNNLESGNYATASLAKLAKIAIDADDGSVVFGVLNSSEQVVYLYVVE